MSKYKRMLALVAVNRDSQTVAQRALQLSRVHGATLALAAVVDVKRGIKSDRVEFIRTDAAQPAQMRGVRTQLEQMMVEIGCDGGCEIIVCRGGMANVVAELTSSWRPDLVLVDAHASHGIEADRANFAYDVLLVQSSRQGFAGRMINAIAATL